MRIPVPAKPTKPRQAFIPPMGWHPATIERAIEEDGRAVLTWKLRVDRRVCRQALTYSPAELGVVLATLGFETGEIELEDIAGTSARARVVTLGGRRSWKIAEIAPETA